MHSCSIHLVDLSDLLANYLLVFVKCSVLNETLLSVDNSLCLSLSLRLCVLEGKAVDLLHQGLIIVIILV